jgi:hypothetical protein
VASQVVLTDLAADVLTGAPTAPARLNSVRDGT